MRTLAEFAYGAIFVHGAQSEAAGCLTGASAWGSSAFSHRTPKLRKNVEALCLGLRRRLRKRIEAEENREGEEEEETGAWVRMRRSLSRH